MIYEYYKYVLHALLGGLFLFTVGCDVSGKKRVKEIAAASPEKNNAIVQNGNSGDSNGFKIDDGIAKEVAAFGRCFTLFSNITVRPGNGLLKKVREGELSAVDACISVLDKVQVGEQGVAEQDALSKAVLNNFNHLHESWFLYRDFMTRVGVISERELLDSSVPALYFTRALFDPKAKIQDVLLSYRLQAVRTNNTPENGFRIMVTAPVEAKSQVNITNTIYRNNARLPFPDVGDLLNIIRIPSQGVFNAYGIIAAGSQPRNFKLPAKISYGTGAIGTAEYLRKSVSEARSGAYDGGVDVPRAFGKAVLHDFLCRDLPALRIEDAKALNPHAGKSQVVFKKQNNCAVCHLSMDRLSGVVRGLTYPLIRDATAVPPFNLHLHLGIRTPDVTLPATDWPLNTMSNFPMQQPVGHLSYRDFEGARQNHKVAGLNDLSRKIAASDDFYICVTKRYFEYLTGMHVDISDPMGRERSDAEDFVIRTGLDLRKHQSGKKTLESILRSQFYK